MTLTRTLRLGSVGKDVEAAGRALHRYLHTGRLDEFEKKPQAVRRTFGLGKRDLVKQAQRKAKIPETGVLGPITDEALTAYGAYDATAKLLVKQWELENLLPEIVNAVPLGHQVYIGGLHPTAGLLGNWALDFICPAFTPIVAVEKAKVTKLSGRSGFDDTMDAAGVYGWSIHYQTPEGYRYFATHFGRRADLTVGQALNVGDTIGWVGDQRFRPDHIHLGVTSPLGVSDAKKRMEIIRKAPRVG